MESKDIKSESSDTDKTSGSLFKVTKGCVKKRREELPVSYPKNYMIVDEFCSSVTSLTSSSSDFFNMQLHSRFHHLSKHPKRFKEKSSTDKLLDETATLVYPQRNTLDEEIIAELDRQYDHNICLDRFISEMEQHQTHEPPQQAGLLATRTESVSLSGKADSCSNCSNSSSQCPTCTSGSSSVLPRSNETDSVSHNSESIKSASPECENPLKIMESFQNVVCDPEETPVSTSETKRSSSEPESGIDVNSGLRTSSSSTSQNYKGGKPGRKRKRGYIYDPKPVKVKSKTVIPESQKDDTYWEKRKRNNEAARRSREMRRRMEAEVSNKMSILKKENEALRVTIALLIKRNETLEYILDDYANVEKEIMYTINESPAS
ncbi:uncharacterized protein LOC130621679 [Hydractinia symbiolongicarpus]|uniref:uncharacterized protein LOC130621679 n=1 Tax=Hydractinia symbiolongicarpus TaxID=13093 RepID=UPI00254A6E6D|nr:uncharacterized protein LOC130621679 [Hydractinia symbiolongicarpus]